MPTNFYPTYDESNDQVDRVSSIKSIQFQKIIPRYRLSTSETRDQGTGPGIEEIPVALPSYLKRAPRTTRVNRPNKGALFPYTGTKLDLFA